MSDIAVKQDSRWEAGGPASTGITGLNQWNTHLYLYLGELKHDTISNLLHNPEEAGSSNFGLNHPINQFQ